MGDGDIEVRQRAPHADDFPDGAGAFQRERAGAADEPDADDHQLADAHLDCR